MVVPYATRPTVLVVRHGETAWNAARRMQGHQDVGLNEVGRAQAVRLATRLRNVELGGIVTSDLSRAAETAAAVAAVTGVEVIREPALREQHIGAWEGRLWAEVSAAEPDAIARFLSGDPLWRPPGGETRAELSERVWTALLAHARPGLTGPLLVVTHGGVVWAMLERIRGRPQPDEPRAVAPNASLTTLVPHGDTWDLHAFGDVAHLEGACGAPAAMQRERPSSRRREARGLSNFVTLGVVLIALLLLAWVLSRRAVDSPHAGGQAGAVEVPTVGPPLAVRSRDPIVSDFPANPSQGVPSASASGGSAAAAELSRGTLRVRVTHDGRPVSGALAAYQCRGLGQAVVSLSSGWGHQYYESLPAGDVLRALTSTRPVGLQEAATAANGTAQWEVLRGRYRVWVSRDEGDGRLIGFADSIVGEAPVDLEVPVEFAARIAGVVVDPSGAPVSGVGVLGWLASDARVSNRSIVVSTDRDGRFEFFGFGREAHVVAIYGGPPSGFGAILSEMPRDAPASFDAIEVLEVADLQRVVLRARWVERTVLEVHVPSVCGPAVHHHAAEAREANESMVWRSSFVVGSKLPDHSPGSPLYVVVPSGVACPWYVLRLDGCEPIVEARRPGGLRRLVLRSGRRISGTVTGMSPDVALLVRVHGFVGRGEERVEFHSNQALSRSWTLLDAPCDAFDVAVYWDGDRIGPWVRVPAGDRDVTDVEVALYPPR